MPDKRPFIGITLGHITINGRTIDGTQRDYGDRIADAGGVPLLLPARPASPAEAILSRVSGILLTGGGDVEPERYGAERANESAGIDSERDTAEDALLTGATAAGIPILAICRGAQLVNVARGGTLVQHLPTVTAEPHLVIDRPREDVHSVRLDPSSYLCSILGIDELGVNSLHHQGVDRVGSGLRPVAWAEDGTIEALEDRRRRVIAVQWHPEQLPDRPEQMRLFSWLIEQAAAQGRPKP